VFAAAGTAKDPRENKDIGKCESLVMLVEYFLDIACSDDRQRLFVHFGLRNDLGAWNLDSYRRNVPYKDESQAGCAFDCE